MRNLNKNYIKHLSELKTLKATQKKKNIYINLDKTFKVKRFNTSKIISTCLINGRLKRVYKNNKVSRHFLRDELKKNFADVWSVKSW